MSSRHKLTTTTFRPAPEEIAAARLHIPKGRTLDGFLRATLRALAADPQRLLEVLAPHWPPSKPRGRPPKNQPAKK